MLIRGWLKSNELSSARLMKGAIDRIPFDGACTDVYDPNHRDIIEELT